MAAALPSIVAARTYAGDRVSVEELKDMRQHTSQLADMLTALQRGNTLAERHRAAVRPQQQLQRTCWYHCEYGRAARKCVPPCMYEGNDRGRH
ncbi:hypothetical protein HPB50_027650 [Hyalomma asiaticum]|nr:hypothetical protein HPB50_027650 [Hyalomma asiaticum]